MNNIESDFLEKNNLFLEQISKDQDLVISEIDSLIQGVELEIMSGDNLISIRFKLSRFSETLGEFIYYHESRSDFAYIWRKGQYASDWIPTKDELNRNLKSSRVTNSEVESVLTEKYLHEQLYSMFHRRRADYLSGKLSAISMILRSIDHRIYELRRQEGLKQDN